MEKPEINTLTFLITVISKLETKHHFETIKSNTTRNTVHFSHNYTRPQQAFPNVSQYPLIKSSDWSLETNEENLTYSNMVEILGHAIILHILFASTNYD